MKTIIASLLLISSVSFAENCKQLSFTATGTGESVEGANRDSVASCKEVLSDFVKSCIRKEGMPSYSMPVTCKVVKNEITLEAIVSYTKLVGKAKCCFDFAR